MDKEIWPRPNSKSSRNKDSKCWTRAPSRHADWRKSAPKSVRIHCLYHYSANSNSEFLEFFNGILKSHPLAPTSTTPIYSNAAFQILGYVLEEITGKSYETVLKEELINPLNLTRSSYSHPGAKVGVIPGDPKDSAWAVDAGDETP